MSDAAKATYLKTFQDYVKEGRDAGYPIPGFKLYESMSALAAEYGREKNEQYFSVTITPVSVNFEAMVAEAKEAAKQRASDAERERDLAELNRLKAKLNL